MERTAIDQMSVCSVNISPYKSELMDDSAAPYPLTDLIQTAAAGTPNAKEELYRRVYDDLRAAAHGVMRREHNAGDLQTSAIVNEVVLRFENGDVLKSIANRRVFFSIAIRAMHQILIDHYRRRRKLIDSPDRSSMPLDKAIHWIEAQVGADFTDLELALGVLHGHSERQYSVVTHRFFGGLTIEETADILDVSVQTVERDWRLARARLLRELQQN